MQSNGLFVISVVIIIIVYVSSVVSGTRGPTFTKEPSDEINFSNETGTSIDCQAQGLPIPTITWMRSDNNGKIDDVPDLRIIHPNGTLTFLPFRAENYRQDLHASVYKCIATNPLGVAISRSVRIRAVVKQNYEANVYDEFVIRRNTAVMRCHIPSFVQDYVIVTAWTREDSKGSSVINNGGRYSVFPSGALHIRDVGKDDTYRYRCKTKHILTKEVKMSASSGKLIVTDPQSSVASRITHYLPLIESEQGKNVEVPCAAQGFPNPHYTWWKVKRGLRESVRKGSRYEMRSGSLFIHGVQISDEATYTCEVNNSVSTEKAETILTVTASLSAFIQPSFQQIDVGKAANMTCSASGYPITSLEWFKDGNPLGMADDGHVRFITPEMLRIEQVQREDSGIYQCFVKNKMSSSQSVAQLKLGDAMPIFHETFPEKVYQRGATVSLKCTIYGNPPPQVSWSVNERPLPRNPRYLAQELVNLRGDVISYVNISNINTEDGGEYSCTGKNRVGKIEHTAKIDVHGPPYVRMMANITAVSGDLMRIKCRVSGYPIHTVTWERDGTQLPINHRQRVYPNGTLEVEQVERLIDEGAYTCVARNHHGETDRRTVYVNLISVPTITPFGFPPNLREGMRAGITCFITDGDLPITIQWLKDGGPLAAHMDVTTNTLNEFTSTLVINSIRPRNNGNYSCVASNMAASTNYTAQLLVNVPPRWSIEPRDTNVTLDKMATIDCQSDGFPYPNITWKKRLGNGLGDYRTIHYVDSENRIAQNGSLIIERVDEGSEGYYLCQANNGVGSGLSKLAYLRVHIPARFEVRKRQENARRGTSAKLTCEAKGESPLMITWEKNNSIIDQHQDPRISIKDIIMSTRKKSELTIHKTERSDHAEFTCRANNNYGSDSTTIVLAILERPETPRKLNVNQVSSRSVELSWTVPFDGNTPITKYKYQYKHSKDPWTRNDLMGYVMGNFTAITVASLLPATKYTFRVGAENEVGLSNYSETVTATTLEEAPSGAPLSIRVEALSSQSLRVSWKPPRQDLLNGEILGYHIGHRLLDSTDAATQMYVFESKENGRVVTSTDNEVTFSNLLKYSKYGVVIEAYNRMGTGPRSQEIVAETMEDTPSYPPQDVRCISVTSSTAKVQWEPPPEHSINGILLGYKIYSTSEILEETKEPKTTSSNVVQLEDLRPFTNYSIRVVAFTKMGDGVRSKATHCRTEQDVPSAPEDIKALVMSSDAILLTWRPPVQPNGILTKYTVYRHGGHVEVQISNLSLPPGELVHEARSLREGYQYEFWVTASTTVGEGKRSRKVMSSPQSTVPAKIGSFKEIVVVHRKTDVRLPCRAVGIPTPEKYWHKRNEKLQESSRIRITSDGTLYIADSRTSDSGNYTCRVENIYAGDEITHEVVVKVKKEKAQPPSAPILTIRETTKSSIKVAWKVEDDGGSHIKGFTLNYKKEDGSWQELIIESENTSHVLENLFCGSRYHIYMSADNTEGSSEISKIEVASTKGFPPIIPSQDQLLYPNRSTIMVILDAWIESGCQIRHFVLECMPKGDHDWMLIANDVKPTRIVYPIRDLMPNKTYMVRVSAVSEYGTTRAEYEVTTQDELRGGYVSDVTMEGRLRHLPFYLNLNVIIPLAVAVIVLITIVATIYDVMRRRQHNTFKRTSYTSRGGSALPTLKHRPGDDNLEPDGDGTTHGGGGSGVHLSSSPSRVHRSHSSGAQEDVSPYATYQLPECVSNNDDESGIRMQTFAQLGTPTAVNAMPPGDTTISPNKKLLYSKVRKPRPSGFPQRQRYPSLPVETLSPFDEHRGFALEKHKGPPPREILRMHPYIESSSSVTPSAPPAEYDSNHTNKPSPDSPNYSLKLEQSMRTKPCHRVPDLLYHRQDSSTSNETSSSSPETQHSGRTISPDRNRSNQNKKPCRKSSWSHSRGSSPECATEEQTYTINKALGPPAGFMDSSREIGGNNPADESTVGTSHTGKQNKGVDSMRLAAAEEELIALLKRGTTTSTTTTTSAHLHTGKDEFAVRV